jgi:hypothetical protein
MALKIETVRTSETSVYFYKTTRHYITESCHSSLNLYERYDNTDHTTKMAASRTFEVGTILSGASV